MILRALSEIPSIPRPPRPDKNGKRLSDAFRRLFSPESKPPREREIIAGGDIKWKPVDLTAAKMLMRSPEINKPMQP